MALRRPRGLGESPGDYFTSSHIGEPIIIVRNRDGILKAFSSVCQHRAALVADGHGNARSFRCPYHHWTYSLDGGLLGAPRWNGRAISTRARSACRSFKLEVWLGFIFINFDPNAAPLAPRLQAVTDFSKTSISAPRMRSTDVPALTKEHWNWT